MRWPWLTAEDYYALYGIFSSTRFSFPGCEPKGQPRDLVPLLTQAEVNARTNAWRQRNEEAVAEKKRRDESTVSFRTAIKDMATKSSRLLAEAKIMEGASVSFADSKSVALDQLSLKKGE